MQRIKIFYFLFLSAFFLACDNDGSTSEMESDPAMNTFDSSLASESGSDEVPPSGGGSNGGVQGEAGLVTAAEWNDLEHWSFWQELLQGEEFANKPSYWNFYNNNRISVVLRDNSDKPIVDQALRLEKEGRVIWEAKTDNQGTAELFIGLRQKSEVSNMDQYGLYTGGQLLSDDVMLFSEGVNNIRLNSSGALSEKVELAYIVDATGSMSDELEFLKQDLLSVINKVAQEQPNLDILTASVFYRDVEDDYLVRHSGFSSNINTTLDFIKEQRADGGGDYPEAVHTALETALGELQWSNSARARLAFLLLDAPPHNNSSVIQVLQSEIEKAAKMGVKLIPITASGIDQETEYLMRSFAIATNGTYVFITNDSGIGNGHLEASVGEYQVEKLNDLMVRLINEYTAR